jgi:peptidoglycan/LPS O-acetylase OafA/YrhL
MKLLTISILPYFWIFAIGIFMRLFWKNIQKFFIGYGIYYLIIYLVFSSFMLYFTDTLGNYKTELYLSTIIQTILMAFAMFSMAFSYTHIKFNRKTDLSYSTYLYHMLIVQILIGFGVMNSWYLYFIVIGATFCIAYLSWTYIEKPMLKFKP